MLLSDTLESKSIGHINLFLIRRQQTRAEFASEVQELMRGVYQKKGTKRYQEYTWMVREVATT